jgi:hypothetical protein
VLAWLRRLALRNDIGLLVGRDGRPFDVWVLFVLVRIRDRRVEAPHV